MNMMYFVIEISHTILSYSCYIEVKKINYMLEIAILRNYSQNVCVPSKGGISEGLGVQMTSRHPAG